MIYVMILVIRADEQSRWLDLVEALADCGDFLFTGDQIWWFSFSVGDLLFLWW